MCRLLMQRLSLMHHTSRLRAGGGGGAPAHLVLDPSSPASILAALSVLMPMYRGLMVDKLGEAAASFVCDAFAKLASSAPAISQPPLQSAVRVEAWVAPEQERGNPNAGKRSRRRRHKPNIVSIITPTKPSQPAPIQSAPQQDSELKEGKDEKDEKEIEVKEPIKHTRQTRASTLIRVIQKAWQYGNIKSTIDDNRVHQFVSITWADEMQKQQETQPTTTFTDGQVISLVGPILTTNFKPKTSQKHVHDRLTDARLRRAAKELGLTLHTLTQPLS